MYELNWLDWTYRLHACTVRICVYGKYFPWKKQRQKKSLKIDFLIQNDSWIKTLKEKISSDDFILVVYIFRYSLTHISFGPAIVHTQGEKKILYSFTPLRRAMMFRFSFLCRFSFFPFFLYNFFLFLIPSSKQKFSSYLLMPVISDIYTKCASSASLCV